VARTARKTGRKVATARRAKATPTLPSA